MAQAESDGAGQPERTWVALIWHVDLFRALACFPGINPEQKTLNPEASGQVPNKKSKEGRHVGLDFYDLLIGALIDRMMRVIDFSPTAG
jgi:hypothetical protein